MRFLLGGYAARRHRQENLQLILNRKHPGNREPALPTWAAAQRAAGVALHPERHRADIRQHRIEILGRIAVEQARIAAAERQIAKSRAAVNDAQFQLQQLDIEDQLLGMRR